MKKTKLRIKWRNLIILLIGIISAITLLYSTVKIYIWIFDNQKTSKETKQIEETTNVEEIDDSEKTEIINQDPEIDKDNPYWNYLKMKLIDVNFEDLKKENSDVKGWIKVNGTNINYPFVQTDNNNYYLTHSFNKSYNAAGWVFLDYRNNNQNFNKNTILYAHSRVDSTMFGSLKNIMKSNWYHNSDNYVIKLSTEYENTLWQVISVYHLPTTNDYLQISFATDSEYLNFLNLITARSIYNFNTTINEKDIILTLSTCYHQDEKMVMHAKLIKREVRNNN